MFTLWYILTLEWTSQALYHVLPMTHVSVTKLQSLLEGEVNQIAARKILDKMVRHGIIEPKGSKRLGKRVIHSDLTERKFIEVQKALSATTEAMDVDHCEPNSKSKKTGFRLNGSNYDVSTYGVLHSIGSDLTRMKVTSETNYNDSGNGQKASKAKEPGNTPISRPVISRESFAQGKENGRTNGIANQGDEADTIICSKSSQDKRPRKTSAAKEPIHQNMKRQRSEAQWTWIQVCESWHKHGSRSLHSEEGSQFSRNRHVASGSSKFGLERSQGVGPNEDPPPSLTNTETCVLDSICAVVWDLDANKYIPCLVPCPL